MKIEFENIVENWSKAQKAGAVLPCPRCGKMKMKDDVCENALSRRADICVCNSCGTEEALEDFGNRYVSAVTGKMYILRNIVVVLIGRVSDQGPFR
jgi:hypothetical protein|nr:MAG TPA: 50S ribosomal subunit [Caudoviricetes sp.]